VLAQGADTSIALAPSESRINAMRSPPRPGPTAGAGMCCRLSAACLAPENVGFDARRLPPPPPWLGVRMPPHPFGPLPLARDLPEKAAPRLLEGFALMQRSSSYSRRMIHHSRIRRKSALRRARSRLDREAPATAVSGRACPTSGVRQSQASARSERGEMRIPSASFLLETGHGLRSHLAGLLLRPGGGREAALRCWAAYQPVMGANPRRHRL